MLVSILAILLQALLKIKQIFFKHETYILNNCNENGDTQTLLLFDDVRIPTILIKCLLGNDHIKKSLPTFVVKFPFAISKYDFDCFDLLLLFNLICLISADFCFNLTDFDFN